MKTRIVALAVIGLLIFSCKAKVAVGTTQPDVVQVPPKVPSPNETPTTVASEEKMIYDNECGRCHKIFAPTDYSKEEWGPILVRMQKKGQISDEVMAKINHYVYSNL